MATPSLLHGRFIRLPAEIPYPLGGFFRGGPVRIVGRVQDTDSIRKRFALSLPCQLLLDGLFDEAAAPALPHEPVKLLDEFARQEDVRANLRMHDVHPFRR